MVIKAVLDTLLLFVNYSEGGGTDGGNGGIRSGRESPQQRTGSPDSSNGFNTAQLLKEAIEAYSDSKGKWLSYMYMYICGIRWFTCMLPISHWIYLEWIKIDFFQNHQSTNISPYTAPKSTACIMYCTSYVYTCTLEYTCTCLLAIISVAFCHIPQKFIPHSPFYASFFTGMQYTHTHTHSPLLGISLDSE